MTQRLNARLFVIALLTSAGFGAGSLFAASDSAPPQRQMTVDVVRVAGPGGGGAALGAITGGAGLPVEQTGTGIIVGQVVDANGGSPVVGAVVSIGGSIGGLARGGNFAFSVPGGGGRGPSGAETVPRVLTDSNGRFAFRNLPAGSFNISAQKASYIDGAYGRLRPNGASQSVQLTDDQRRDDITVRVFKPAAITGRIVDERGEPIVGATVRAYRRTLSAGRRVLSPEGQSESTDDRGVYRFGGLMPGEYVIAVPTVLQSAPADFSLAGNMPADLLSTMVTPGSSSFSYSSGGSQVSPDSGYVLQPGPGLGNTAPESDGRLLSYPTVYYPSASVVSEAAPIVVASGEERSSIDIAVGLTTTATISGRLTGPDGPAVNYALHLVPSDTGAMSADPDVATAITGSDGAFMFFGVPAGNYVVQTVRVPRALPRLGGNATIIEGGGNVMVFSRAETSRGGGPPPPEPDPEPTLWTATPVSVGRVDIQDLTLNLQEGYTISGRVEFEGSAERPTPEQMTRIVVQPDSADGKQRARVQPGQVDEEGQFETPGLVPGRYIIRSQNAGPNWTLKSVTANGVDISEMPLNLDDDIDGVVITFTDRSASLSGVTRDSSGAPDEAAAVIVFPADNRAWMDYGTNPRRMRLVRSTSTGAFVFNALPPGDYYLVAVREEFANDWQDPRFLEQVATLGTRVTVSEGMDLTRDLSTATQFRGMSGRQPAPEADPWPAALSGEGERPHGPFVPDTPEPVAIGVQARDRFVRPASGSSSVSGRVLLDDGSGQPLRRARVSLRNAESSIDRAVMTDDTGSFSLSGLPAGRYSLTASKPAYVTTYYGSRRPGRGPGTPLALTAGATIDDVVLRMPRGAVISGQVIDTIGQPVSGATIRVYQRGTSGGRRIMAPVPGLRLGEETDDRGRFRVFGLTPGEYVVMVRPSLTGPGELRQLSPSDVDAALADVRNNTSVGNPGSSTSAPATPAGPQTPFGGRAVGFAPVYFPGTTRASAASTVTVTAGQEVLNVDIPVELVPMARIEGTISGPDGQPVSGVTAMLLPESDDSDFGLPSVSSIIRTSADGTFSASNVAPGRYTLMARSAGGVTQVMEFGGGGVFVARTEDVRGGIASETPVDETPPTPLWAQASLDVNGLDIAGVSLTLQEGMSVTGHAVFDGTMPAPEDLSDVRINIRPAEEQGGLSFGVPGVRLEPDGTFTLAGVTPGSYRVTASVPPSGFSADQGWRLRSAMLGGVDTLDTTLTVEPGRDVEGVVLTFSDKTTELSGTITDPAGDPVSDLTVLVFPTDPSLWTPNTRRMPNPQQPGSDGMFQISSLPPGDYHVAVVTQIDEGQWGDPAFMEQVAAASIPVRLAEGEKKVQDIRIGGGS